MSLLQELKRRNVIKVTVAYIVVAWLVAQVLQLVFESFGSPDWVMKTVLVLMAAGLLFAVFFAWAFELTPEGLKREKDVDRSQSITPQTGQKLNHAIFALMALAIAYFAIDKFVLRGEPQPVIEQAGTAAQPTTDTNVTEPEPEPAARAENKSVAVLPFVDMSPEKDQEYFTDGLTENLLNALAQLRELKVAGRTSSFAFKGRNEDLRSIGEQLGVAHLLEGSVQKAGNRVRITAQLVNADDGYHLWSQTYDRTLEDIFAVQDEIASEVAEAMQVTLLGKASPAPEKVSELTGAAYNDYLKGLYERNRGTVEGNQRAMEHFQRAIEEDPSLALAWAGMALSRAYLTGFDDEDFAPGYEKARASALRALELDPDLPEAHLALSEIQQAFDWDWAAAEASLDRAIALRPGDSEIRMKRAQLLSTLGRKQEALAESRTAAELDPLDWPAQHSYARALIMDEYSEQAHAIFERLKALDPERPVLHWSMGRMFAVGGDHEKALEEYRQEKLEFLALCGQATSYHHLGQKDQALTALQKLISTVGESASYQIASVYAQWGDVDNAMSWLERGYTIRDPGLQYLVPDWFFDPLREDPRFQALLRKMNLAGS
jgi:TolB-like protein/Flp pilus assembly protein TadD